MRSRDVRAGPLRRSLPRAAGLMAGLAMVLGVLAGCSDEEPPGYDEAFRTDFEAACRSGVAGDADVEACACWYERVSAEVPFDELPSIDALTAPAIDEEEVDAPVYELLADCVRAFGAVQSTPAPAPPPLTLPRATTTTTTTVLAG